MSFQTAIENRTPFAASKFILSDLEGQEAVLVVVSATFEAPDGDRLRLADEQSLIRAADVYRGDPESTSVIYESDVALTKPSVDVVVDGHAYAPDGASSRVPVRVRVGDIDKMLVVTGDRDHGGRAMPFRTMPIIYERAFGGVSPNGMDQRNPVGLGYRGAVSPDPRVRTALPNVEYPDGRSEPAGFGIIGRGWKPRIDFAGTYDEGWLKTRWPLLPADFDPRHNQTAPLDQQSRTLSGGEDAEILNMTPNGLWRFRVPSLDVPARFLYDDRTQSTRFMFDTLRIEPDHYRVTLTARAAIVTIRNAGPLREVVLGHVTRAWMRARESRKFYIDYSGGDGTNPARPTFRL